MNTGSPTKKRRPAKPAPELTVEAGRGDKGDHPPAASVAVVKPLDRGGHIKPCEQQRHRNGDDLRKQGHLDCRVGIEIDGCGNADDVDCKGAGGNAEEVADDGQRHQRKDHRAQDDQHREPISGAVDAALKV
jgi:hypothetical protein